MLVSEKCQRQQHRDRGVQILPPLPNLEKHNLLPARRLRFLVLRLPPFVARIFQLPAWKHSSVDLLDHIRKAIVLQLQKYRCRIQAQFRNLPCDPSNSRFPVGVVEARKITDATSSVAIIDTRIEKEPLCVVADCPR